MRLSYADNPKQANLLNDPSNLLATRYKHTGESQDLEEAIGKGETSLKILPTGHSYCALFLNHLSNKFAFRYERTDGLQVLEEALARVREAVKLTGLTTPVSQRGSVI